ncbi:MAG: ferredoxin, partial [Bacteriovoracaceae bacterium]
NYKKPVYHTVQRSFIAEPLPASNMALKIQSNPEFAGDFAAAGADAGATVENFSLAKVWIEDGCIVCDACETISPDVFEVKDGGCIVRPGAPLENGLNIQEAAEACPVEIIKFTKAN